MSVLLLVAFGALVLASATRKVATTVSETLREIEPGIFAKAGVVTDGVAAWTWEAMRKVRDVCSSMGVQMIVTSLKDSPGSHMTGSRHERGEAFDIRTVNLTEARQKELADAIAKKLGASYVYPGYYHGATADVISHPTEKEIAAKSAVVRHIHVEKEG